MATWIYTTEAEFQPHPWLWRTASKMLELAKDQKGSFYNSLAATCFATFALEAFVNFAGLKLFGETDWNEFDQEKPRPSLDGKLRKVIGELGLNEHLNFGCQPLQSVKELTRFRNHWVHGKTQRIIRPERGDDEYMPGWAQTELEADCNYETTKSRVDAVDRIVGLIWDALRERLVDDRLGPGPWGPAAQVTYGRRDSRD